MHDGDGGAVLSGDLEDTKRAQIKDFAKYPELRFLDRHHLAVAFGWVLGRARVLAPVALALGGGVLLLAPVLPAVRPLRSGALSLFASVTMAPTSPPWAT